MTENNDGKFKLIDRKSREAVLMERTGEPFYYSTKEIAERARKTLEAHRKATLQVVPA